jgi:hypothetical protein
MNNFLVTKAATIGPSVTAVTALSGRSVYVLDYLRGYSLGIRIPVEELCYKLENRGFQSRWSHWIFPVCLTLPAAHKSVPQDFSWGKKNPALKADYISAICESFSFLPLQYRSSTVAQIVGELISKCTALRCRRECYSALYLWVCACVQGALSPLKSFRWIVIARAEVPVVM